MPSDLVRYQVTLLTHQQCKYGEDCQYGQCKPVCPADKPDQCPNPQKYGALECTNKQKDLKNCGQCGTKVNHL